MVRSINSRHSEVKDHVAIAMTTFYRADSESDRIRAKIAKRTIRNATESGYNIVVVDGGSFEEFLRELESYGLRITPQKEKGMEASKREVFQAAYDSGRKVVTATEPEKEGYIANIPRVVRPILEGKADLVIPDRRPLRNYPALQVEAESFGDLCWFRLTGYDLDMWSGLRAFDRYFTRYFSEYRGIYPNERGQTLLYIPVMDLIADGHRVTGVKIDYTHPIEQREFEEGNPEFDKKRIKQLEELVPNLITHRQKLIHKWPVSG
jgi:hypothetical protein